LAVAAVRAQGVTLRQLADDFGVSRERARTIGLAGLRALEREVLRLPEDGHGLGAEELLDRPVDVLGLDVRPANALHRGGVATIRQLVSHSAAELLRLPYLGELSLRNIRHRLAACGLSLRRCPGDARPPE
jgi:DNA-directed RNA polymerase alpha subunit